VSRGWLEQRERGSVAAMRALARLSLALGRGAGRLFLYPICLYFVLFSVAARRASRAYLARVLGRPAGLREVLRHYHAFASTVHDRVFLLAGRLERFEFEFHGLPEFEVAMAQGRGCVLLGAHLGSFEAMRALALRMRKLPLSVLMYRDNAAKTEAVLREIAPESAERVIALGRPEALLRVRECLERGEAVGILGDRILGGDKSVRCEFLGGLARFPLGPLLVPVLLDVPIVLFFGLYLGGNRYAIRFERFECDAGAAARGEREARLASCVARYAQRLDHYCRLAPYNWFNFYDFWETHGA
jgi:predicted LPLAT superfamily acyltransferase